MALRCQLEATIAKANRKRYLLEKRRKQSINVPHFTQRTYVAINGDAYTCIHGGLWKPANLFVVRSLYKIGIIICYLQTMKFNLKTHADVFFMYIFSARAIEQSLKKTYLPIAQKTSSADR